MTERKPYTLEIDGELPQRWERLRAEVKWAKIERSMDPRYPLVQIGRFEALGELGYGGCGIVFEVHDPKFDRVAALKLCLADGDRAAEMIMNEGRVMARLSHPNIVTVYEPGQYGEDVFFVMEYVEGITGRKLILETPRWPRVVDIYIDAGRGLAAAHEGGVIHRDFKPSNILIDQDDRARVSDFGLARVVLDPRSDEGQRSRPGTLQYMAPEVLRGKGGDARSDQWSFCVALWETLNLLPPVHGDTREEVLEYIENRLPEVMPDLTLPEALSRIARKGLSLDPNDRYLDMGALVDELEELRKPPAPELESPSRGSSWTSAIVALLIALVSVLAVLSWVRLRTELQATRADQSDDVPRAGFEFPCALGPEDEPGNVRPELVAVCQEIRQTKLAVANQHWVDEYDKRRQRIQARVEALRTAGGVTGDQQVALMEQRRAKLEEELARETSIVAQTFLAQAERLREAASTAAQARAEQLEKQADRATSTGEYWLRRIEDVLDGVDSHSAAEQ